MIWLVLFKLQRYSHLGNTAVVRSQQKGSGKEKKQVKIYLFNESDDFAIPKRVSKPKIACIKLALES